MTYGEDARIPDGSVLEAHLLSEDEEEYLRAGGSEEGLIEEFKRFTSDKKNYTDALIILSTGPYSAVPAAEAGLECTHFICRRLFREKIDAVWDELVADAVGLVAAFGRYDVDLASRFLGIREGVYTGGRLEIYKGEAGPEALAGKVYRTMLHLDQCIRSLGPLPPYDLAIRLEDEYDVWKTL